jgi:phage tail-like protein
MAGTGLVSVATLRQWTSYALHDLVADADDDVLVLRWEVPPPVGPGAADNGPPPAPAGLAVDPACFVYHAVVADGRVERVRWLGSTYSEATDVLVPAEPPSMGPFDVVGPPAGGVQAVALAVDDESRLFVVDDADAAVAVYDLADRRLLQRMRLPGRALDAAGVGSAVVVLCDDPVEPLWRVRARRRPEGLGPVGAGLGLVRIAAGPSGLLYGLDGAGLVMALEPFAHFGVVAGATDIEVAGDGSIVVADRRGAEFRRFSVEDVVDRDLRPLVARDYDGRGIVRMPDGSIGFWTRAGRLRRTVAAMLRYQGKGSVTVGPLDGHTYRESWGRVLVDACLPQGTSIKVAAASTDDEDEPPELGRAQPLRCRETGPEVPWARPADDDPYETLEAPVGFGQGRYLWLRLELRGTTRATPKLRAVRAEHPGHDLLRRLPRTYSRDPAAASFLYRYLAIVAGLLGDVERRADERDVLLDPDAAPASVLPWLAGLVGMTLDARWSERARRTVVREAACLFRKRGTKDALERMIEIYLDRDVAPASTEHACPVGDGSPARRDPVRRRRPRIVELYQVRGQGGGVLGGASTGSDAGPAWSGAVVGAGLRVGGAVGVSSSQPLEGTVQDAFSRSAHRFSVVIPARLDASQEQAVRDLLDAHKPAHTAYSLCTVGAGMRVGQGLYLELTSIVGPGSGFEQLRVGDSALGRDAVLGRPRGGIRPGSARIGTTTRFES